MSSLNQPLRMFVFLLVLSVLALGMDCWGQQDQTINWEHGPTTGKLGDIAQIVVPKGYQFSGKAGAQRVLELTHNPTSGDELGVIVPEAQKENWFVTFDFHEVGYVKDDEKDKLDGDKILASIKEGTEESNKIRQQRGWTPFHVTGWSTPPFYDARTNNLTWAVRGYSEENQKREESINQSVRILGRHGTMNVDLVLSPDEVESAVPEFQSVMDHFSFTPGHTYSEFRPGDKVASYGLTALIAGGAGALAVKTGLLAKLWKVLVAIAIAVIGVLKKLFRYIRKMLTGKASEETIEQNE